MPTYNRASFIPKALESINSQSFKDWELIIVDDGSTDNSQALIESLTKSHEKTIKYIKQKNQGPAIARNTGIKAATGDYIAFFDSDDIWLEHHLNDCISAMQDHPEISWVYGACQRIDLSTNEIILNSTFYSEDKQPNPLFNLAGRQFNKLHIIEDSSAASCQIKYGIDSGLQNSVIKREVFADMLLPEFRIGEDRLFIAMALKAGFTLAFIDNIHVYYNVHDENISDTNVNEESVLKRIDVMQQLINSYEKTPSYIANLTKSELSILNKRIADDYFWKLGYALQWQSGQTKQALRSYQQGLKKAPFKFKFWKTYLLALLRA